MESDVFSQSARGSTKGSIQVGRKIEDIQKPRLSLFERMGYRVQLFLSYFFLYTQVISNLVCSICSDLTSVNNYHPSNIITS